MRVTRKTLCVSFSIVFGLKTALTGIKNLKKRRRKLKGKSIELSLAVPGCFKEMQVRNKEVSTIEVSPDPLFRSLQTQKFRTGAAPLFYFLHQHWAPSFRRWRNWGAEKSSLEREESSLALEPNSSDVSPGLQSQVTHAQNVFSLKWRNALNRELGPRLFKCDWEPPAVTNSLWNQQASGLITFTRI